MSANLALLRSTYEGASGENVTRLLSVLAPDAEWVEATAFRNSSLQGAYLLMAARARGLDAGAMSVSMPPR